MPITEIDDTAKAKKMPVSRVHEPCVGPEGHNNDEQERADQHHERCCGKDDPVGAARENVFFLDELANFGKQLHRACGSGFHRAKTALHEAHHLEQVQIDERTGGQEHGSQATGGAERCFDPECERDHRSISPKMK